MEACGMKVVNRLTALSVLAEPIYVNWKGASGRLYPFELNPIGTPYQAHPGVYIFCHFGPLNRMVPDYIDEADDFARRIHRELGTHRQWANIRAAGSTHICTLHVPGKASDRVKVEVDLRRANPTSCNSQWGQSAALRMFGAGEAAA
jgi:hypothetical protein